MLTLPRPPPHREDWELEVVRALTGVVKDSRFFLGVLAPARRTDAGDPAHLRFLEQLKDLTNFLRFGESSLTPEEASSLAIGLGVKPDGTAGAYMAGDRVEYAARFNDHREEGRGIMIDSRTILVGSAFGGPPSVRYLQNDSSGSTEVTRLLHGALLDTRHR